MVFFSRLGGAIARLHSLATGLHYTHVLLEGPRSIAGFIIIFPWSNDSFFYQIEDECIVFGWQLVFKIHSGVSLPKHLNHMLSGI